MATEIVVADSVQVQIDKSFGHLLAKHGEADSGGDGQYLASVAANADEIRYQAERAVIDSTENLGKGADLIKIIGNLQKEVDERRKARTAPLDAHKKLLIGFFGVPLGVLENAKTVIAGKCSIFRAQEAKRLQAEADAKRAAAEAEALAHADAAQQLGADGGAVLDAAVAVIADIEPERVKAAGTYGATFSETKRWVGTVTNVRAFLAWLVASGTDEELADILGPFSKRGLNNLAREQGEGRRLVLTSCFRGEQVSVDRVA